MCLPWFNLIKIKLVLFLRRRTVVTWRWSRFERLAHVSWPAACDGRQSNPRPVVDRTGYC